MVVVAAGLPHVALRRGPFLVEPEGPGDASPARQRERCGRRGPQLRSSSSSHSAPNPTAPGEHRALSAAHERTLAPKTTTTRPKTRQQLP